MTQLQPFYQDVQAHYDLSNEFFALFLDPSMTYSCAYFEQDNMTLAEAQLAKIDLSLGKCGLPPLANAQSEKRLRLLDVGCGWGATARRAAEKYNVDVIGLTLSVNQHQYAMSSVSSDGSPPRAGQVDFRLQGWEEFTEPVDRIVSIGAFEHFRIERYPQFFSRCRSILPADGSARMMLHTIVMSDWDALRKQGESVEHEHVLFGKFILKHIFPGGQLCMPHVLIKHAEQAGFRVEKTQSLRLHYARTLDCWANNLHAKREHAIELTSPEFYEIYMHYFNGCAKYFRSGHIDVMQFTLTA